MTGLYWPPVSHLCASTMMYVLTNTGRGGDCLDMELSLHITLMIRQLIFVRPTLTWMVLLLSLGGHTTTTYASFGQSWRSFGRGDNVVAGPVTGVVCRGRLILMELLVICFAWQAATLPRRGTPTARTWVLSDTVIYWLRWSLVSLTAGHSLAYKILIVCVWLSFYIHYRLYFNKCRPQVVLIKP